jgi:hypothetical protein
MAGKAPRPGGLALSDSCEDNGSCEHCSSRTYKARENTNKYSSSTGGRERMQWKTCQREARAEAKRDAMSLRSREAPSDGDEHARI